VTPGEAYDFSASSQRLEVKSAAGEERNHYFTLEQLHPPASTRVLIASLFVQGAGGGQSLAELLDRVRSRVAGASSRGSRPGSPEATWGRERG
jgi:hypothetical protein